MGNLGVSRDTGSVDGCSNCFALNAYKKLCALLFESELSLPGVLALLYGDCDHFWFELIYVFTYR